MPDENETPYPVPSPLESPAPDRDARPTGIVSPPPSSGSSLFLKICLVLGGVSLIGSCAAILSPMGRDITRSTFDLMSSVGGAAAAPGTNALREIGCDTALVMPFGAILNPIEELAGTLGEPEELGDEVHALDETLLVQCSPGLWRDEDLTCEQIARTYGEATGTTEEFLVMLERADETACSGFYRSDGTLTRPLDAFENVPDNVF